MMDKKNHKRFLKCFLASMVILVFIAANLIAFNTSCLADNDPNPYCSGDSEKIQELTEDFINKYGEGVEIRWDKDTGYLEKILYFNLSGFGDFKDRAFSFLSENSSFLGIDVNDLEFLSVSGLEKVTFKQLYKGLPVHEGKIWVSLAKEGGSKYSVTLKRYYFCVDVDVLPTITKEEAAAIVMGNLGVTELFNLVYPQSQKIGVKKPASTQLLVYPKGGDAYLCWEFIFNQGNQDYIWYYYIDAHTGEIIYNYKGGGYTGSSSGTTSGNLFYNPYPSWTSGNSVWFPGPSFYNPYPSWTSGDSVWFPAPSKSSNFSTSNLTLNYGDYSNSFLPSLNSYPYIGHNYSPYYPERYAFSINPQEPYGRYFSLYSYNYPNYNYSNYNYPFYGYASSNPYSLLPSGIFNLLASSNLNTAQKGIELMYDYWPPF